MSIIGRYILLPEVFGYLEEKKKGAGGEIQLTDSMARMIGDAPFHGLRFEGTKVRLWETRSGSLKPMLHLLWRDRIYMAR